VSPQPPFGPFFHHPERTDLPSMAIARRPLRGRTGPGPEHTMSYSNTSTSRSPELASSLTGKMARCPFFPCQQIRGQNRSRKISGMLPPGVIAGGTEALRLYPMQRFSDQGPPFACIRNGFNTPGPPGSSLTLVGSPRGYRFVRRAIHVRRPIGFQIVKCCPFFRPRSAPLYPANPPPPPRKPAADRGVIAVLKRESHPPMRRWGGPKPHRRPRPRRYLTGHQKVFSWPVCSAFFPSPRWVVRAGRQIPVPSDFRSRGPPPRLAAKVPPRALMVGRPVALGYTFHLFVFGRSAASRRLSRHFYGRRLLRRLCPARAGLFCSAACW